MKEEKLEVKEGYKELSKCYDEFFNIATLSEEDHFYKLIEDVKDKQILDVGCGTGRYSIPLAEKGAYVHGIDFSEEMLMVAREKAEKRRLDFIFNHSS